MRYANVVIGNFVARPNRFIAHVMLDGEEVVCHVKNTGRCRELLAPGAKVVLAVSDNPARKTKYDLVAVWKGDVLINMDSQAPNAAFGEWARQNGFPEGLTLLRAETKYGNSRFDFYYEAAMGDAAIPQASRPAPFAQGSPGSEMRYDGGNGEDGCKLLFDADKGDEATAIPQASRPAPFTQGSLGSEEHYNSRNGAGFIEVKGVTLENDGVVRFPDAPTERGAKHVRELIKCREDGYGAHIAFVVQMRGMKYFAPNAETDPDFAAALKEARAAGVEIIALECVVTQDSMEITGFLPVRLD